jgi:ATP-dependent exoDNAse (exonuclease V) alpha subunit
VGCKCQGKTYDHVLVDLAKPRSGGSPSASLYVQLSRCRALNSLSIMRPFDTTELHTALSRDLLTELDRQEAMDRQTRSRL